jgi:hypothetical protein
MATPSRPTFQAHARELARAFDVRLIESDQLKPEEALAIPPLRVVLVRTITEEMSYAVALHEIGHLASPTGVLTGERTARLQLTQEDAAWTWARHYALEWTPAMERLAQYAEGTYQQAKPSPEPPAPAAPIRQQIDWSDWK